MRWGRHAAVHCGQNTAVGASHGPDTVVAHDGDPVRARRRTPVAEPIDLDDEPARGRRPARRRVRGRARALPAPARRRRSSNSSPTGSSSAAGRPTRSSCSRSHAGDGDPAARPPRGAPRPADARAAGSHGRVASRSRSSTAAARADGRRAAAPRHGERTGCRHRRDPRGRTSIDGTGPALARSARPRCAAAARVPHRAARPDGPRHRVRRRPPARLRELGAATERPEWVAAADFIDEYLRIVSSARRAPARPGRAGPLRGRRDREGRSRRAGVAAFAWSSSTTCRRRPSRRSRSCARSPARRRGHRVRRSRCRGERVPRR